MAYLPRYRVFLPLLLGRKQSRSCGIQSGGYLDRFLEQQFLEQQFLEQPILEQQFRGYLFRGYPWQQPNTDTDSIEPLLRQRCHTG